MSHRIAISFAAAVIGMACIATDASARGGGGGGGGKGGGPVRGVTAIKSYGGGSPGYIYKGVSVPVQAGGTGGGAAAGARYYAPASYNSYAPASYYSNVACGRYPYPPCKRVSPR